MIAVDIIVPVAPDGLDQTENVMRLTCRRLEMEFHAENVTV